MSNRVKATTRANHAAKDLLSAVAQVRYLMSTGSSTREQYVELMQEVYGEAAIVCEELGIDDEFA